MVKRVFIVIFTALAFSNVFSQNENCASIESGVTKLLAANSSTVHWGYYFEKLAPNLVVASGDIVDIEMISHHAGDAYDEMIKGDPGIEDIYKWTEESGQNIKTRGATGKGDGVHILTGPIYVCGAEPGDVVQIDILELVPRKNPSTGKTYGVNGALDWGYQFRAGFLDGKPREVVTVYEIIEEGGGYYVVPEYSYHFSDPSAGYLGPTTPCAALNGSTPGVVAGYNNEWSNPNSVFSGHEVACEDGKQTWPGYYYPGVITTQPTGTEDYSIKGKFKVPANLHIGNIGVSPAWNSTVTSVAPSIGGGNMDNRRLGPGSTLYLPVQVTGALLSAGDGHAAQGNSELSGTGVETSMDGKLRITLHKADALPPVVKGLAQPVIETPEHWIIQGYTYSDYLNQLPDPQNTIFEESSIDRAMTVAYNATRDWMMTSLNATEDEVISAISIGADFGITQVVDGNWGVHAVVPKKPFGLPTIGTV